MPLKIHFGLPHDAGSVLEFADAALAGQLQQLLVSYFDLEEFKTLCFRLGVNYDGLPGEGLDARAREFILYLNRRRRLERLVEELQRARPELTMPTVASNQKTSAAPFTSESVEKTS